MKSRASVLVVEDSLAVAKRLQSPLERVGLSVEFARNGSEALTMARRKQFDVVVTDEQMPVMSGRELCRQLRNDKRYARTPIIFLTGGRSQLDTAELTEQLQVAAIFDKPFRPEVIARMIENELVAAQTG